MNSSNINYRLRIAPSPTGFPHIGTIYQALFNYAYAKKHDGTFIVRIEDTDRARFVEGAEEVIYHALDWFNLTEDESPRKGGDLLPYKQSERLKIYYTYVQELLDKDKAYYAYYPKAQAGGKKEYSAEQHSEKKEIGSIPEQPSSIEEMIKSGEWIIRMRVPQDKSVTFRDEIRGDITFEQKQITEQVLLKSDGFPTYHLAVVVDDHLMQITHVVRAEEWISSTPKHVLLYQYFGWDLPKFYHTPDLRNPDKSKLSKRHGHTNVNWYREEGYLPEAILNFLALQGWTHPEEKEIFSLEEFIQVFDLKDVRAVGPIFDLQKLTWMNQQYILKLSDEELKQRLFAFDSSLENKTKGIINQLIPLVKTRMQTLKEFISLTEHFFNPEIVSIDNENKKIAQDLRDTLAKIDGWNTENILYSLRGVLQSNGIKMPILYTILTGNPRGLPLPESLVILGKEKTLERLEKYA